MKRSTAIKMIIVFTLIVSVGFSFLYLLNFILGIPIFLIMIGIGLVCSIGKCFSCHKKIWSVWTRRDEEYILMFGYQPPEGMSEYDELCKSCLDNIKNIQVQEVRLKQGKYEKELSVRRNVIGSFIPLCNLLVLMNLGWRYGTLSLLTNCVMIISFFVFLDTYDHVYEPILEGISIFDAVILSIFTLHVLITWYFIKKHNARVKANKNLNISPN